MNCKKALQFNRVHKIDVFEELEFPVNMEAIIPSVSAILTRLKSVFLG